MKIYKPEGTYNNKFNGRFNGFRRDTLEQFMASGKVVEAPVSKCDNELNLYINLGKNITGVIPSDEFEYNMHGQPTKSIAIISKVDKRVNFKIMEIKDEEDGSVTVKLSRKQAQIDCYNDFISKLKLGQLIDAKITHVEKYGAFCDIGCGITALLPIEHFCVARIKDAKSALSNYEFIKVIVKDIDESGKIILSQKELLGTWEEEVAKFKQGDIAAGTVRMIEKYGIFVELTPNLAGLAEMNPSVKIGDGVSVFIKSIVPEKMKIKLVIVSKSESNKQATGELNYRLPESGFVERWQYSPDCCEKQIVTSFEGRNK